MSDFEIEGINLLKQALTQMSRQPKARLGRDNIGEPEYWMPLPELPRKKRSEAA